MTPTSPLDIHHIRNDFPMLKHKMHGKPLIYFDSAATAQKPKAVIDAITNFYSDHYGTVHRAVYQLAELSSANYERARQKIQTFLNAQQREEIIFTRGTTESINLVATCFGKAFVKEGDEILISAMEHHSNIVPWQMMCQEKGAHVKVIPMNEKGELLLEEFEKQLSHRTRLVAVNQVSNALGTVNPIKEMAALAHASGAYILVDGAQSAPHQKIDVQALDVDFFAFSGHKAMGPTGIGVLYGKAALLNAMPPYQGGGDMIEKVTFEKTTYNRLPLKFEAGTPMIAEVIGLAAAIDYLESIDLDKIHQWEQQLLAYATEKLQAIPGFRMIGQAKNKGAIISFIIDNIHALDLGTFLDLQGIAIRTGHHCAQPVMDYFHLPSTSRASFAFYNTKEEIDTFVDNLHSAVKKFGK